MMRHAPLVRAAALALTVAALSACSDQTPTTAPAAERPNLITNGIRTGTSFGNVGALLIDVGGDGTVNGLCSGTLIAPTVFLTAGHCTDFPASTDFYVTFQPTVLPLSSLIPATATFTHPDFSFPYNDLGIVLLPAGSTTGITPAEIPTIGYLDEAFERGAFARTPAVLVGYGTASGGRGNLEPTLEAGIPRKVALTRIQQVYSEFLILANNAVNAGKGGACEGDSGGPVFLASDTNLIVAVTSFGQDAACITHGGYVRIDTEAAQSFITPFLD